MFLLRASIFSTFYFRFRVYSGCYDRCRNLSIREKKTFLVKTDENLSTLTKVSFIDRR